MTKLQNAAYFVSHARLRRARGSASGYLCDAGCTSQAQCWAQVHGTTGEAPADYMPMCWHCHTIYDQTPETSARMSAARTGRPNPHKGHRPSDENIAAFVAASRNKSPEQRAKISATLTGRSLSPEHRAAISRGLKAKRAATS